MAGRKTTPMKADLLPTSDYDGLLGASPNSWNNRGAGLHVRSIAS